MPWEKCFIKFFFQEAQVNRNAKYNEILKKKCVRSLISLSLVGLCGDPCAFFVHNEHDETCLYFDTTMIHEGKEL